MITDEEKEQAMKRYFKVCEMLEIRRKRPLTPSERGILHWNNYKFGKHIDKLNFEMEYKNLKEILRQ